MKELNVFITGASSGLGRAIAARFRNGGHTVLGTTHESVVATRDPELTFFNYPSPIEPMVKDVMRQFGGRLDVLVNNAGTNAILPFENLTPAFVQHIMTVNFEMPVFLTQTFLPYLSAAHPGIVVNIISDAAWRPMRQSLAYNCSKAALDMATKQMARELTKPHDMSIIGIRPGKMFGTGMSTYIDQRVQEVRGWTADEAMAYFKANSVSGHELNPADVAAFIHSIVTGGMVRQLSGACIDLVG